MDQRYLSANRSPHTLDPLSYIERCRYLPLDDYSLKLLSNTVPKGTTQVDLCRLYVESLTCKLSVSLPSYAQILFCTSTYV
jgi:hypothetical protein